MKFIEKFGSELNRGLLVKRYKRFLADVKLDNGEIKTIFVPNTGSMKSCLFPNTPCYFTTTPSATRKYDSTLQLLSEEDGSSLIGINTHLTNSLVQEFIQNNSLSAIIEAEDIRLIKPEYKVGKSRFDFYLETKQNKKILIEVKNVTMKQGDMATFPDAISTRGQKHLQELAKLKVEYGRCIQLYLIQRENLHTYTFAQDIDPKYFQYAQEAKSKGVEFFAFACKLSLSQIDLKQQVPIQWN